MGNRFERSSFQNTTVTLDHVEFDGCTFRNCKLVYSADGVVSMVNCSMYGCSWEFTGAAERTVQFMTALYAMGGAPKELVEKTLQNIRRGTHGASGPPVN